MFTKSIRICRLATNACINCAARAENFVEHANSRARIAFDYASADKVGRRVSYDTTRLFVCVCDDHNHIHTHETETPSAGSAAGCQDGGDDDVQPFFLKKELHKFRMCLI